MWLRVWCVWALQRVHTGILLCANHWQAGWEQAWTHPAVHVGALAALSLPCTPAFLHCNFSVFLIQTSTHTHAHIRTHTHISFKHFCNRHAVLWHTSVSPKLFSVENRKLQTQFLKSLLWNLSEKSLKILYKNKNEEKLKLSFCACLNEIINLFDMLLWYFLEFEHI